VISKLAIDAKQASRELGVKTTSEKNEVLRLMAKNLSAGYKTIIKQNEIDINHAQKVGLSNAITDRLLLNQDRIEKMAEGVFQVSKLPDPVGEVIDHWKRPNGLQIKQVRVPIGLIGMIYESRPNVTADASSLCLKSGNACLLRGGKEAIHSNLAIIKILQASLKQKKFPAACISFVNNVDRKYVDEMLTLNGIIDVIIPRGGKGLVKKIMEDSKIPVIKHYDGNCHIYVDQFADLKKALLICLNAKVQKPGVCNAAETFLIHEKIAKVFLPKLIEALEANQVKVKGCSKTVKLFKTEKATEQDWYEEYLDLVIAIKIVSSVEEAIEHINHYGSMHTESIISKNKTNIQKFEKGIDSAVILSNASTRFNDGFEFGFGAEIGISTDKLHARGPVGLKELTTYKYLIKGNGQIRK
jgi:glutamate-5-semialdehyde dehydrogenase